jgi:hypothetical protein
MTRDALAVTEELKVTAGRCREEVKRAFVQIENCSRVTAEVRNTYRNDGKIAAPATTDRLKPKKK